MTIVSVTTQAFDRYCLESLNPAFAHIWVILIEASAVTIAMYSLIHFYVQIRSDIAQHKPLLKILAIKLVIFLSFWQTIALTLLTSTGLIASSAKIQTPDIKIGIPAMLLCIEMAVFSVFHLWAFTYRPYSLRSKLYMAELVPGEAPQAYQGGFLGIKAIIDSMNPWDMVKAIGRAAKWLFRDRKHRHLDVSYDLSRKTSENADIPKPALFDSQTAYTGGRPPHYGGGDPSEGQTLLANQQAMGASVSRVDTSPYRTDHSPYRTDTQNNNNGSGDIGVATSSYDERPHNQAYGRQQTGLVPVPYPEHRGRQVKLPYFPPPPTTGRQDNMF
jgi:Organic solute transporter Ostalpha